MAVGDRLTSHSPPAAGEQARGRRPPAAQAPPARPTAARPDRTELRDSSAAFSTHWLTHEIATLKTASQRDREAGRAEGAVDADQAVVADHRRALLGREAGDHRTRHSRGCSGSPCDKRHRLERPHLVFLVEQAPDEVVERQRRGSVSSSAFTDPASTATCGHSGWSSRVCSRSRPSSPSGKCWNSRPPATQPRSSLLRREPDDRSGSAPTGRNSFAPPRQALALQRHDALVALVGRRLVEGDRQIALAEQREQRRVRPGLGQPLGIVADIAAQLAAEIVAHQQVDDAVLGLRLERQLAAADP